MIPWVHPTQQPKRYLDRVSRFSTIFGCNQGTNRQNGRANRRFAMLTVRRG